MTIPFSHNRKVISIDEIRPRPKPVPVTDLAELREREEEGDGAAMAMYCDGLGGDPVEAHPLKAEVELLGGEVAAVLSRLAYLRGAVPPRCLAGSVLGVMGNNAEEIRRQLKPLRAALRKLEGGDAA